jgi:hypothetical protein
MDGYCSCKCVGDCPINKMNNALCTANQLRDWIKKNATTEALKASNKRYKVANRKLLRIKAILEEQK